MTGVIWLAESLSEKVVNHADHLLLRRTIPTWKLQCCFAQSKFFQYPPVKTLAEAAPSYIIRRIYPPDLPSSKSPCLGAIVDPWENPQIPHHLILHGACASSGAFDIGDIHNCFLWRFQYPRTVI